MNIEFKEKNIIVTGAGRGIGHELCRRLSSYGANVYALSRSVEPLKALKAECPTITVVPVDLSKWNETRTVLHSLLDGKVIDGLVNNAGIAVIKPCDELTEKDFDEQFDINVKAVFNVTQCVIPHMKSGGSIVNLSSLAGLSAIAGHSIYSASKAAVDGLTRGFALELGPKNIRVNSVNPTVVMTEMSKANWHDPVKIKRLTDNIPLGRFAELHESIDPIIYLLSDKSSFINGHSLPIEGGYSAC